MVEVSDSVFESVVQPFKRKKSFAKLVAMLLEAYATNDSIYSYINGAMDGLENEATEELLKDLNSMAESLSMLGALSSEAESVVGNGQKVFDEFGDKAYQDNIKNVVEPKEDTGISREDVEGIVNDSVSEIKDMLMEILGGRMPVERVVEKPKYVVREEVVEKPKYEEVVKEPKYEEAQEVIKEEVVKEPEYNEVHEVVKEEVIEEPKVEEAQEISEEEEEKAQDALASLMGSIGF